MLSYICKIEKLIVDYYTDCSKVPFNDINCYDAILLDIDMPNENGISYAKRLRKTYHDIPMFLYHGTLLMNMKVFRYILSCLFIKRIFKKK